MKWQSLLILCSLLLVCAPVVRSAAQDDPQTRIIFTQAGDIVVADGDGQNVRILADGEAYDPIYTMPEKTTYNRAYLSPSGETAILTRWFNDTLWRVALDGGSAPEAFSELTVMTSMGVAFSPDGSMAGVVVAGTEMLDDGRMLMEFWAVSLADQSAELKTTFPFAVGCGGGPELPDAQAYHMQAGFMGNTPVLAWLAGDILLVSTTCAGTGLQTVLLATGEATLIDEHIARAQLNPGATQVAGLVSGEMHVIDLASGDRITYPREGLDQFAWTPDGDIVFTTVQTRDTLALSPADPQLASDLLFGIVPTEVALYEVGIYHLDMDTMTEAMLWLSPDWRGVASMVVIEDTLYFGAVSNLEPMVSALNEGKLFNEVITLWPQSHLYRMPLDGSSAPEVIAEGGSTPTPAQ